MIVFRRVTTIRPDSVLLEWVGLDGAVKQWFFTADNAESSKVKFEQISNINSFRGIPGDNERLIDLITFSLSEQEYDFIKDLQFTNLITATLDGITLSASMTNIKVVENNPQKLRDFKLRLMLQGTIQMTN